MTDRNVRKLTDKMLEKAQAGIYESFSRRQLEKQSLYKRQRLFLEAYSSKYEKTKIVSIVSYVLKEEPKKKTKKNTKAITSKDKLKNKPMKLRDKASTSKKSTETKKSAVDKPSNG